MTRFLSATWCISRRKSAGVLPSVIFDMPVSKRKVRATIVIARRIARELRIRIQALIDPKGNKSDAVGMFFDEDELV